MNLTTPQVAAKLGVSKTTVATLARKGKLPTVNKPENGKRVEWQFDSKVVAEFRKSYTPVHRGGKRNGHAVQPKNLGGMLSLLQLMAQRAEATAKRVDALDKKMSEMLALWS